MFRDRKKIWDNEDLDILSSVCPEARSPREGGEEQTRGPAHSRRDFQQ